MLVELNQENNLYAIAITETSDFAELTSDLSYLTDVPPGQLIFDFTPTTSNLTQANAYDHLPGNFGFHSTDRIVEQTSFIARMVQMPLFAQCPHDVSVILPKRTSHLGKFFDELGMFDLLEQWQIPVIEQKIWEAHTAHDDESRLVLLPLTDVWFDSEGYLHTHTTERIKPRIVNTFYDIFDRSPDFAEILSSSVNQIIEGVARLTCGGLLTALYYPETGYFEFSIISRTGGNFEVDPEQYLNTLMSRFESAPANFHNANDEIRRFHGTFQMSYGFASIIFAMDGSTVTRCEYFDLPTTNIPGLHATVVLQLPPQSTYMWESFARDRVTAIWKSILN